MPDDPAAAEAPATTLARFLVGRPGAHPSVGQLRAAGVSSLAFVRTPDHPERSTLRHDFMATSARHLAVRRAVVELVAAWRAAGIEALVFKGFYLAEFVYASPGERGYHDVDLAVRPERAEAACAIAEAQGWRILWRLGQPDNAWSARPPSYAGHEVAQLRHRQLEVTVDLHRRLAHNTHNRLPSARAQTRLTAAAWSASRSLAWLGTELRVLDPRDSVVLGPAVNRGWGSDAWRPKTRDYPDFEALVERHGLTLDGLLARARELGVPKTFEVFLERCDPFRQHLRLEAPSWPTVRGINLRVAGERGWVDLERGAFATIDAVRDALELVRALPVVRAADRHVAHGRAPGGWHVVPASTPSRPLGSRAWRDVRRSVHRSLRLLKVPDARRMATATLAAFALLRRRHAGVALEVRVDGGAPSPVLTLDGVVLDAQSAAVDAG